jgi:hypothetical protein
MPAEPDIAGIVLRFGRRKIPKFGESFAPDQKIKSNLPAGLFKLLSKLIHVQPMLGHFTRAKKHDRNIVRV